VKMMVNSSGGASTELVHKARGGGKKEGWLSWGGADQGRRGERDGGSMGLAA